MILNKINFPHERISRKDISDEVMLNIVEQMETMQDIVLFLNRFPVGVVYAKIEQLLSKHLIYIQDNQVYYDSKIFLTVNGFQVLEQGEG